MKVKSKRPPPQTCCLCKTNTVDQVNLGEFLKKENILCHYYCLLLSSTLQGGRDSDGIKGFLLKDIRVELAKARRVQCVYCQKYGATVLCQRCRKAFHLPCGLQNDSMHQFFGAFRSYCRDHRIVQRIPPAVQREMLNRPEPDCAICFEPVVPNPVPTTLWAPCCKKNAWFHRTCVQQLALSSGYFFKCPLCNSDKSFKRAMKEQGIYIPRRDAAWETDPHAYAELLERYRHCDARRCLAKRGRSYNLEGSRYEIILCGSCGSQGIHAACGNLDFHDTVDWQCPSCKRILKNSQFSEPSTSSAGMLHRAPKKNRRNPSLSRKRKRTESERRICGKVVPASRSVNEDNPDSDVQVTKKRVVNSVNRKCEPCNSKVAIRSPRRLSRMETGTTSVEYNETFSARMRELVLLSAESKETAIEYLKPKHRSDDGNNPDCHLSLPTTSNLGYYKLTVCGSCVCAVKTWPSWTGETTDEKCFPALSVKQKIFIPEGTISSCTNPDFGCNLSTVMRNHSKRVLNISLQVNCCYHVRKGGQNISKLAAGRVEPHFSFKEFEKLVRCNSLLLSPVLQPKVVLVRLSKNITGTVKCSDIPGYVSNPVSNLKRKMIEGIDNYGKGHNLIKSITRRKNITQTFGGRNAHRHHSFSLFSKREKKYSSDTYPAYHRVTGFFQENYNFFRRNKSLIFKERLSRLVRRRMLSINSRHYIRSYGKPGFGVRELKGLGIWDDTFDDIVVASRTRSGNRIGLSFF